MQSAFNALQGAVPRSWPRAVYSLVSLSQCIGTMKLDAKNTIPSPDWLTKLININQ
jgi:hypothetical protein